MGFLVCRISWSCHHFGTVGVKGFALRNFPCLFSWRQNGTECIWTIIPHTKCSCGNWSMEKGSFECWGNRISLLFAVHLTALGDWPVYWMGLLSLTICTSPLSCLTTSATMVDLWPYVLSEAIIVGPKCNQDHFCRRRIENCYYGADLGQFQQLLR